MKGNFYPIKPGSFTEVLFWHCKESTCQCKSTWKQSQTHDIWLNWASTKEIHCVNRVTFGVNRHITKEHSWVSDASSMKMEIPVPVFGLGAIFYQHCWITRYRTCSMVLMVPNQEASVIPVCPGTNLTSALGHSIKGFASHSLICPNFTPELGRILAPIWKKGTLVLDGPDIFCCTGLCLGQLRWIACQRNQERLLFFHSFVVWQEFLTLVQIIQEALHLKAEGRSCNWTNSPEFWVGSLTKTHPIENMVGLWTPSSKQGVHVDQCDSLLQMVGHVCKDCEEGGKIPHFAAIAKKRYFELSNKLGDSVSPGQQPRGRETGCHHQWTSTDILSLTTSVHVQMNRTEGIGMAHTFCWDERKDVWFGWLAGCGGCKPKAPNVCPRAQQRLYFNAIQLINESIGLHRTY